jgi:dolichol-phosphate mannosyltransferase
MGSSCYLSGCDRGSGLLDFDYRVVCTAGSLIRRALICSSPGDNMRVSVIVPVADAAGSVGRVVEEVYRCVPAALLGEVIVVDDASTDATPEVIKTLITIGLLPHLRYLRHDRRCGAGIALHTGVAAARFPIVATLAGTGENDPVDIPRLVERLAPLGMGGPVLACGVRARRRTAGAAFASRVSALLVPRRGPDPDCGVCAFWQWPFLKLPPFPRMNRYLAALFHSQGQAVVHVPVNDRPPLSVGMPAVRGRRTPLVALRDGLGVRWLIARGRLPELTEQWPDGGLGPATAPAADHDTRTIA